MPAGTFGTAKLPCILPILFGSIPLPTPVPLKEINTRPLKPPPLTLISVPGLPWLGCTDTLPVALAVGIVESRMLAIRSVKITVTILFFRLFCFFGNNSTPASYIATFSHLILLAKEFFGTKFFCLQIL